MTTIRRNRSPRRRWHSLAILLSLAAVGAVTAAPLELPPLQAGAAGEHHVGKVIWVELITPGLATAKSFYGGLFGWTYGGRGRQAVFSDPDGAVFAVLDSSSGDPGDYLAEPGEWIWSSLLAKNPDAAAKFYQHIFGYDVFDLPSTDGLEHLVLSNEDYARAGVNALPADKLHRRSHWLNFVRVEDTVETVRKAVALGGRVLVEPHLDRHGGKVALLADPAGAPFGILEWTAADSQVEPR
jgi:predicted enzyme related to lactoylglutathione lyase